MTKLDKLNKEKALNIAFEFGQIDGAHHKTWVIDQIVRALTGCDGNAESEEYKTLIAQYCDGEDGENTYEWDTGIAP